MKKKFALLAIFLSAYVAFVFGLMPASWLISQFTLPKNVQLVGVDGAIWQSQIRQVQVDNMRLNNVKSSWSLVSILSLNPELKLVFGDAFTDGAEGQLLVSDLMGDISVSDLSVSIPANDIAKELNLAIDVSAHEFIDVNISQFVVGKPVCQIMQGTLTWRKAAVTAFEQTVKLGALAATLSCDKGELVIDVDGNNDLGLTFEALVSQGGHVSGRGYLTPGTKFPAPLKDLLSFLGKADNQGRYRLTL